MDARKGIECEKYWDRYRRREDGSNKTKQKKINVGNRSYEPSANLITSRTLYGVQCMAYTQ